MSENRDEEGRFVAQPDCAKPFEEGNQAALGPAFGAEGALKRIQKGQVFIGLALQVYHEALEDLALDFLKLTPIERMRARIVAELEADRRLFGMAALGASESGDTDAWERYTHRKGWLAGKTLSALKDLESEQANSNTIDYDELIRRLRDDRS